MPGTRIKRPWLDPNREGKGGGRRAQRYCARCGNSVRKVRILKSHNLCEYCYRELVERKDGVWTCKACGKFAPEEIRKYKGYCSECLCRVCGRPDPDYVRKTDLCRRCAENVGEFCLNCGKEAPAQVRKNRGYCDLCFRKK